MVHGLHLNFGFLAFCSVFYCFYFSSGVDLRKIWYAALLCPHNDIIQESRCVFRDDPVGSQQFHVWVKVSFPSETIRKSVDGAAVGWNPAEGKAMLARFNHVAASSRHIYFRAIWLEDLAAVPAGPEFWIWFWAGFGAKTKGSLFAHLWQRGGFGGVTRQFEIEAFIFSVFLDYTCKRA